MTSNFAFLHEKFPELAELGRLAERYRRSDSNSCLIKLGMLGEAMVCSMFAGDRITLPDGADAATRITILRRRGILSDDLAEAFHSLRRCRNRAVHEGFTCSEKSGRDLLQRAHSVCVWFMQTYGDADALCQPFVIPEEDTEPAFNGTTTDDVLVRRAADRAAKLPVVPEDTRLKRAERAVGKRYVSEAETRCLIDAQLRKVGWEADSETLRHSRGVRPQKNRNLAIAEWPTDSAVGNRGFADYVLFVGLKMVAVIEAKAAHRDIPSVIDFQCKDYARHVRAEDAPYRVGEWRGYGVPFLFAANGRPYLKQWEEKSGIWFQDLREASNVPRALHGWMSPRGIGEALKRDVAAGNRRLEAMPSDFLTDGNGLNLRDYQVRAIRAAEEAVRGGARTALLAMATGTGKTRTVLGLMYRFLKTERFQRILFLVDRTALGEQAQDAFNDVKLEELMSLDKLYNIAGLEDAFVEAETRVHVSTVQGMMQRILYGEDRESMPAVTDYDLIIVDEAHRGYILDREMGEDERLFRDQRDYQSKYREVVEYFDAVKIALTATPALQTTRIFGRPVFSYSYREAVIDGFLVDHDPPHRLKTKLSDEGIHYRPGDRVAMYDPVTGEITNSELLDDELDFEVDDFNKRVVNENFNREILKEIAGDIDPEDLSTGKTLVYAVNDQHADMIVRILKEVYAGYCVDTDSIMKITGSVGGGNRKKVLEAIRRFKNERFPSIAVTVDLLTTGIDVPEITRLVFMRRVKSRILFEQMLGRATRLCPDIRKTHFEIYDAVGAYDGLSSVSTMKPVVADPSASFEQLLSGLEKMEDRPRILNQINQIVARLQRRKRTMTDEAMQNFMDMAGGVPEAFIEEVESRTPEQARTFLLEHAELFRMLQSEGYAGTHPVVVSDTPDQLISHTRGYGKDNLKPEDYLEAFARYVRENRNEIAALDVVCTRPRDLTRDTLKSLRLTLGRKGFTARQLSSAVSQMSNVEIAADIISLIRRYGINAALRSHEDRIRRAVNRLKAAHNFSRMESRWIDRMEKYLLNESVLNIQTFNEDVRFRESGFAGINKIFQNNLESVVRELNDYLYDDGNHAA